MDAAQRFFRSARSMSNVPPTQVTTDGHDSYPRAIRETLGPKVKHRCSAYMNRRIERNHREVKQRYYPMLGFGALPSAILAGLRGSSAVLSPTPQTEPSHLTRRRQTTVPVPSTPPGSSLRRCITSYILKIEAKDRLLYRVPSVLTVSCWGGQTACQNECEHCHYSFIMASSRGLCATYIPRTIRLCFLF
jgi:hypothetical protein